MPYPDQIVFAFPEAAALVEAHASRLDPPEQIETIAIDQALGRCLAVGIQADRDQPPFHRSTRDGYALRAADLREGREIRIIGQLRAGQPPFPSLVEPQQAVEIMTGAPMPPGTDAVLMVEHAEVLPGEPPVLGPYPGRALKPGDNVVVAGREAVAGSVIVPVGTRLAAMHIGAAVSCGAAKVEVYRKPRVAILATGDELVEPGAPVLDFQIRNSNSYSLAAQVERSGGVPIRLPIARDTIDDLRQALKQAMDADLILLSGGVSMGKFDLVEQVLQDAHAEFFFTGVRMQPGRPVVFGRLPAEDHYFFGLPGNPVSTMVTFALFAAPLIRALGGETSPRPLFARARLTTDFAHGTGLTRFLPALLATTWENAEVTPIAWQGSGDLAATARANCFIVIPPDQPRLAAGDEVSVLLAYL